MQKTPQQAEMFPVTDTLQAAKKRFHDFMLAGETATCEVCNRRGRFYKRLVNANVTSFLIKLVLLDAKRGKYHHIRDVLGGDGSYPKASTDASYLEHWRLLTRGDAMKDGRRGGMYSPTQRGVDFVNGITRVEAFGVFYDNRVMTWSADVVDVREALGTKFDYDELMGWKP